MEQLYEADLVREIPDIFTLSSDSLQELEGWGELSAAKAVAAISASKTTTFAGLIAALGIRHVGEGIAEILEQRFTNLAGLLDATEQDFKDIQGIGKEIAKSLKNQLGTPAMRQTLDRLLALGLTIVPTVQTDGKLPLTGRVFLFTGGLAAFSRDEAKARVKALGGQVASAINAKVTDVVSGEGAGSKLKKARELQLAILSETDFIKLVER